MQANTEGRLQSEGQGDWELSPDEWPAWEVLQACWTNWRIVAGFNSAHYEGIDYSSMESAIRLLGIKRTKHREVFWMVRVMEDEARKWLNKR